jgi:hypothetical protein
MFHSEVQATTSVITDKKKERKEKKSLGQTRGISQARHRPSRVRRGNNTKTEMGDEYLSPAQGGREWGNPIDCYGICIIRRIG